MPELPRDMAARFVAEYGLPDYDATTLTQSMSTAAYFESTARESKHPKIASNWIMGEISRRLNSENRRIEDAPVKPIALATLISRVTDAAAVSTAGARAVLEVMWSESRDDVDAIIEAKGLKQMSDSGALEKIVDEVLAANADNIAQVRAGKDKAFNALVGQVMKASKGKANPAQVNALIRARIEAGA